MPEQESVLTAPLHVLASYEYDLRSDTNVWRYRCLEYNLVAESPTPDEIQAVLEMALADVSHNVKKGAKPPAPSPKEFWDRFAGIEGESAAEFEVPGYNKPIDGFVRLYEPPKAPPKIGSKKRKD